MANKLTTSLGGDIPVRTPYIKTAAGLAGGELVVPTSTSAPVGELTPTAPSEPAPPPAPAKPLTPLEQFHPSLDPTKVEMTWDETTGRLRVMPKGEASPAEQGDAADPTEPPALGEQHASIPGGSEAAANAAPTSDAAQLRDQVGQLTQLVTLMAQAQMSGRPLGEMLGVAAPPTTSVPSEPDYSQLDLQDPAQLAGFIKSQVQAGIQAGLAPHQETMEQARRRQEYDRVAGQFGSDPAFNSKIVAALQLVKQQPNLTIDQGFTLVNQIAQSLGTPSAAAPQPTAPAQPATPAARTITPQQAAEKAAQAARLPGNSGVRGAGAAPMPAHIRGLGQMIAWNLQQASLGN